MHRLQRGLTLIELMVTMVVIAVLVGAVLPTAGGMYRRGQISQTTNDFIMAVNVARSEAARLGGDIALTATSPGSADNEWGGGWTVQNATTDVVAQSFPAAAGGLVLNGTDGVTEIIFNSRGLPDQVVSVDMCSAGGGVRLAITPVGRTSKTELTEGDCAP